MAGSNLVLKKGQRIFAEGEASDGMYLIRKGEVLVYLEKGGTEVKLASLGSGAMIGEMSLFDKKPRSASARATADTEVTKITNDDFGKLMKQIPKWFVGLMSSLSSRLRETNDRLQALEAKKNVNPLLTVVRAMHVLNLIWHKEGTKDGRDWLLDREVCEKLMVATLEISPETTSRICQSLVEGHLIAAKKNNYKNDVFAIVNRGNLERFITFVQEFVQQFPTQPGVPTEFVQMLECLNKMVQESAYDSVTVTLEQVMEEGERRSLNTTTWKSQLHFLKNGSRIISLSKTAEGEIAFKVEKKTFPRLLETYATLAALRNCGVT